MAYLSLVGETVTEKIIERSRFITTSARAEGEEEARAFVERVSQKYRDATHNCYAYIADSTGNFLRFSDNGEPSGTAGMPILEVIKNKKLFCTAVVVTRYFGGIKLGAGGLVRAYSGCAAQNLDAAPKLIFMPCTQSLYSVGYENADFCARYFAENDCEVKGVEYLSQVFYTVAVKSEKVEDFNARLYDSLNGRIDIKPLKEYCDGFKI